MNLYWPKDVLSSRKARKRRRERAWRRAARLGKAVVLSHAHCLDGVTSAIIAKRALEDVSVAFCQPSQVGRAVRLMGNVAGNGRRFIIADLSMQPADLGSIIGACRAARDNGWTFTWLDHHHKQWEGLNLKPLEECVDLTLDRQAKQSGATLVWKELAPKDAVMKALAETVRDRDLWWNKDPRSETLEFALTEMGTDRFMQHFATSSEVVDATIEAAAQRERSRQAQIGARILKGTQYYGSAPNRVAVVYGWLPKNTGLHELLDGTCAVAANIRPNGKMSIRSRQGAEVSHIVAGQFGGGGHPNASGADLKLHGPAYWSYILRRGRGPVSRKVGNAALEALRA